MNGSVRHTTLITSPNPAKMSPLEGAIMDACNQMHEAVAKSDASAIKVLKGHLAELLDRYEASGAENHPQPKWAVPHHRALAASAAEDLHQSLLYEEIALEHAVTNVQKEISLGNLAERSMRTGRIEDAIEYFFRARDVAPRSVPILLTGAQALFVAGHKTESDGIFRSLLGMNEQFASGTELTAYLEYETRLQVMRRELPSLDSMLKKWDVMRREGGGGTNGDGDGAGGHPPTPPARLHLEVHCA
ncbi:MAG: hypothetical protein AB7G11_06075 [Phycisphaerales bacterium]